MHTSESIFSQNFTWYHEPVSSFCATLTISYLDNECELLLFICDFFHFLPFLIYMYISKAARNFRLTQDNSGKCVSQRQGFKWKLEQKFICLFIYSGFMW